MIGTTEISENRSLSTEESVYIISFLISSLVLVGMGLWWISRTISKLIKRHNEIDKDVKTSQPATTSTLLSTTEQTLSVTEKETIDIPISVKNDIKQSIKEQDCHSLVFLDIETPNINNSSVCSLGLVKFENNAVLYEKSILINPQDKFDSFCMDIHGICPADVEKAKVFAEVWEEIKTDLLSSIIVAHNASFDLGVLAIELKRLGINKRMKFRYIDTMCLASNYIYQQKVAKGDLKLETLANLVGAERWQAHDALSDAKDCYSVFAYCKEKYNFSIPNEVQEFDCSTVKLPTQQVTYYKTELREDTKLLNELKAIIESSSNDGILTLEEVSNIVDWCKSHGSLELKYPFDKVYSVCLHALQDNYVSENEHNQIMALCNIASNPIESCSSMNEITIQGRVFCLSGDFRHGAKSKITSILENFGAVVKTSVTKQVDYLVTGAMGSDAYAHGNYGTKVEKALKMQSEGHVIQIITEEKLFETIGL